MLKGGEMAKVYICTEGEYSSYQIVAVFTTPELAEAYRAWNGGNDVQEFELDHVPTLMREGTHGYHVFMWRDGDSVVYLLEDVEPFETTFFLRREWRWAKGVRHYGHRLVVGTVAKSEEHAVKIANERRAQLIASGEWPPDGE